MSGNKISNGRKFVFYVGILLIIIGFFTFISTFFWTPSFSGQNFPDVNQSFSDMNEGFSSFEDQISTQGRRAVTGIVLIIAGSVLSFIGRAGLAGSGIVLNPDKAREDLKPWSKMTGKVINDTLSEIDVVSDLTRTETHEKQVIKVRCQSCSALNEETAKFCNQCGKAI